jgi:hypothetical protein
MRRTVARVVVLVAALVLILPTFAWAQGAVASARDHRTCSLAGVAGTWAHTLTGTLHLPTTSPPTSVPIATVGKATINADGTAAGTQTTSIGGAVSEDTIKATWTLNPDCAGTLTVDIYDQSGNLTRTAHWAAVFDDNQTEYRAIMRSLVRNGTPVPGTVTLTGRKLFPNRHNE